MLSTWVAAALVLCSFLVKRLYSPIAKIPGPWLTKFKSLPIKYHEFSANRRMYIHQLHKQYGPVVRLAPNEVSFASLDAIREIYASGGSGYEKTEFYDMFRQFGVKYAASSGVQAA